jgi:CRP-like cAMP-binding protein
MAGREEIVATLSQFALFADMITPQLEAVAHQFDETWFPEGFRILRQGLTGSGFYILLEGECSILVDGEERAKLGRGEFFGEVSVLLGEPPTADVVARQKVRCLVIGASEAQSFFLSYPRFMYRMLQAQARRLRNANRWRS